MKGLHDIIWSVYFRVIKLEGLFYFFKNVILDWLLNIKDSFFIAYKWF